MIAPITTTANYALVVPAELKGLRQWVVWRREIVKEKTTKVPYMPNGTHADTTKPTTWGDFETCRRAASRFDGIGIVLANGLAGIDLDHHIEGGALSPTASAIISEINTYTEISPSGTGIHCLFFGELPKGGRKNAAAGVEMYDAGRFLTVTGKHLEGTPPHIETRSAEIIALHAKYFEPKNESKPAPKSMPVPLDDQELLERAYESESGTKFYRLYHGDMSAYIGNDGKPDESRADLALCNSLAFWAGDADRMDRLFRESGLMRDKWDEPRGARTYGQMTIDKALADTPNRFQVRTVVEPRANGHAREPEPMTQNSVPDRKRVTSEDYLNALQQLGYTFRLNLAGKVLEINGKPTDDEIEAKIRVQIRDRGFKGMEYLTDAYVGAAFDNAYHPVRDYLSALEWNGQPHIQNLAGKFKDRDSIFPLWLRKWLIGAVAKVYEGGQNVMLVLDGPQNIGKSHFARWLCPLPNFFIEGPIDTDDKDSNIRLMTKMIWEVSELGSTIRRSDREALKFFITQRKVTVRKAFGRRDTEGDAMASLIGTINNEAGFLADPTGSRRFLVCKIESIEWDYSKMDVAQIWAEAVAAYRAGERWNLTPEQSQRRDEINKGFEIDDPIAAMIEKYFDLDPQGDEFMPSLTILKTLEAAHLRGGTSQSNLMAIGSAMKKLGFESIRPKIEGSRRRGFRGVTAKRGAPVIDS